MGHILPWHLDLQTSTATPQNTDIKIARKLSIVTENTNMYFYEPDQTHIVTSSGK